MAEHKKAEAQLNGTDGGHWGSFPYVKDVDYPELKLPFAVSRAVH